MRGGRSLSTRSRIVAPFAVVSAWITRRLPVVADNKEARHDPNSASSLDSLLSLVPAGFSASVDSDLTATFADLAAQLAVAGLAPPNSISDEANMHLWMDAIYPLAIASPFATNFLRLERSLIGFDITDIDQTVEFGLPPGAVTLLRGRFDRDAVASAWAANEYKLLEVDGLTVASLFEDATLDVTSEIGRIALARMNNAAFLLDGTLVYAPTLPLMIEVLATVNGATASLAKRVDVETVLQTTVDPLASAILFEGSVLSITAMIPPDLASEPDALEDLMAQLADPVVPPIAFGLIGMTPGGPTMIPPDGEPPVQSLPPATVVFRLLMAMPGTAVTAATVIDNRLRSMKSAVNQRPYTDFFSSWKIEPTPDGSVLAIDLTPGEGNSVSIWMQLLFRRDLLFLAW